jgi:hypothetical protein
VFTARPAKPVAANSGPSRAFDGTELLGASQYNSEVNEAMLKAAPHNSASWYTQVAELKNSRELPEIPKATIAVQILSVTLIASVVRSKERIRQPAAIRNAKAALNARSIDTAVRRPANRSVNNRSGIRSTAGAIP